MNIKPIGWQQQWDVNNPTNGTLEIPIYNDESHELDLDEESYALLEEWAKKENVSVDEMGTALLIVSIRKWDKFFQKQKKEEG